MLGILIPGLLFLPLFLLLLLDSGLHLFILALLDLFCLHDLGLFNSLNFRPTSVVFILFLFQLELFYCLIFGQMFNLDSFTSTVGIVKFNYLL